MKKKFKKTTVFLGAILMSYLGKAQDKIDSYSQLTDAAYDMLTGTDVVAKDEATALQLLLISADNNDLNAQYLLGHIYAHGNGVKINEEKAFEYIKKAASQNQPNAAHELGVFYKKGIGCKLNFNTAISWFKKAYELGYDQGAYSIGYMYFKGLGSITQDYTKAITWFKKSNYPMSKHFLGICNYFGYGMPINKEKAYELWLDNPYCDNSNVLVNHLDINPNLLDLGIQKDNTTKATEFSISKINEVIGESITENAQENTTRLTKKSLIGEWKGKLIELDWSGERMNRSFPVSLVFNEDNQTNDLSYTMTINKQTSSNYGIFFENSFYLNKATLQLPRIYQDSRTKFTLSHELLSIHSIEIKKIDNIRYLIANIDAKVVDWQEPAPSMILVLGNTRTLTDNGQEIDNKLLDHLANSQTESFITTYPNPFKKDLLIQYNLDKTSLATVSIHPLDNSFVQNITTNETQQAGKHLYHVDGSTFPNGLYVIRVTTGNIVHTKLIIKE
ncbi:T9SS type A sorting domain-containing protein [Aquimarina agarilytica]|uniref:T9SS type A sorting domain-containing protein n=1 Tax=Aquimarina agarilytica TaxID=1087449 RepID=UPI000288D5DA|nr:T9SS type A sorting domain-containing protein [Aquimarina agarilytica]